MKNALRLALVELAMPVVTDYSLFIVLRRLYVDGNFHGERIPSRITRPGSNELRYYIKTLCDERYLRVDEDFSNSAYRVSDVPDAPAEDIAALVDPFCYLSHMSAMQRYGLTTRSPEVLTLSGPANWRAAARQKERQDLDPFPEGEEFYVPLQQFQFPKKVRKRPVALHATKRVPKIKPIRGSWARIAAIGEVFVQMLDRPELCGGMAHILDVWSEHAADYLMDIVDAVDRAPEKIVKVRAGYILNERIGLQAEGIEKWSSFAQRGGSRLLDPTRPYVSRYSEKWMISLNVDSAEGSP